MNEEIITFYYVLFKYILKNALYIYQIEFLLETRKIILKSIKVNNVDLENCRRNNYKIVYVLNYFIEFDYYYQYSLKNKGNNSINSNMSSYHYDSKRDANYQNNYSSQMSNSLSNPFSRDSFKNAKDQSGRNPDPYKELTIAQKEIWDKKFKNEKPYQILTNSKFYFHTNRKGKYPPIVCDEIYIGNENKNSSLSLDEVKQFSFDDVMKKFSSDSDAENLKNNYKDFINTLKTILAKIESEFSFRYKLKFTLEFESKRIENDKIIIKCVYIANIPNEKPSDFKDDNILEMGMSNGYAYFLNEINNEAYKDLKYED